MGGSKGESSRVAGAEIYIWIWPSGFLEHHACNSSMPIETGVGRVAIAFSKEVANLNYNIIKRKHALNSIPRVAMVEVQLGEPTFLYRGLQLGSTA